MTPAQRNAMAELNRIRCGVVWLADWPQRRIAHPAWYVAVAVAALLAVLLVRP